MLLSRSFKIWSIFAVLLLLFSAAQAAVDAGYEAANGVSGTCPTNANASDIFGDNNPNNAQSNGFAACNCTSYVAYRLRLNNVNSSGNLFTNYDWGASGNHFGDASNWDNAAVTAGIRKDNYPAVGSVAHWERITADTSDDGVTDFGHVAYVQHLFTSPNDGKLTHIGVMEYNWAKSTDTDYYHKYRYRKIATGRGYPTNFLHFEENGNDAQNTNATCVSGLSSRPGGANVGTFCWKHNGGNATCSSGTDHYYYDYRTCTKHTVTSGTTPSKSTLCGETTSVSGTTGYTINIGSGFPTPIDPTVLGTDFAMCQSGSTGSGNSRAVSGRLPAPRNKLWRDLSNSALN